MFGLGSLGHISVVICVISAVWFIAACELPGPPATPTLKLMAL